MFNWDAIHWKARQKYSQFRSFLGCGYYVWKVQDGVNFVSRQGDAFSHVLYVCKGHEKTEMSWCTQWVEEGDSIIDCGANIGYFSAFLAQACSLQQILAIEGNEKTAELCRQNFNILGTKNVKLVQAVLCACSSDNFFIPDKPGMEPWQQAVKANSKTGSSYTTTLDELIAEYQVFPSLVKIDCEGFETKILEGSSHVLDSLRPAFMIECNDGALNSAGTSRHELFNAFRECNYKLFHLSSFRGKFPVGLEVDEFFPSSEFNFAAIPSDDSNLNRWNNSIKLFSI